MPAAPNRRAPGLLLAWVLLDASMGIYLGLNGPSTISRILLAAGIAFLLLVLLRRPRAGAQQTVPGIEAGLAAVLSVELAVHALVPFRPELPVPTIPIPLLAVAALVAVAAWLAPRLLNRRDGSAATPVAAAAIGVAVVTALIARFAIIAWDIEPGFDVHLIQISAGKALLDGQNPYAVPTAYYAGYPYWPLSAVLAAGGLLFGDARWGLLLADAVMVAAFVAIARNVGAPARLGALAAALLLWDSSGLYMIWQSLPEPAVIAFGALAIAAITRPANRGRLAGLALGLAVATKQLGLGMLPLLPLTRDRRRRAGFVVAVVVAAAAILPFLALNPSAFLLGSVSSHMVEPARDYAVNLLDLLPGVLPRLNVPLVLTGLLALGLGLAVRLRWPDSIDGWVAGSAMLLTVAFSLIGISFVNYYQIPLSLLLILIMLPDGFVPAATPNDAGSPRPA